MRAGLSSRRHLVIGLFSAITALFFVEANALALRVAVQVPFIDSDAKVSEGRRSKFHDMLVAGLKEAAGGDTIVVSGEETRFALGETPSLLECKDGPCLQKVAELVKADRIIIAQILIKSVVGGSAYTIGLAVYDARGAVTSVTGNETCGDDSEGCNLNRAFAALKRSTASIAAQIGSPAKPEVAPAPNPETAPGASPTLAPGVKEPTETAPLPTGNYNKGYRIGWITFAALTGAFVVSSIPFFAYTAKENQITCAAGVPRNQCPTVYTGNLAPALGLLIGGGVTSATAFGVLFYLDRKERRRAYGK